MRLRELLGFISIAGRTIILTKKDFPEPVFIKESDEVGSIGKCEFLDSEVNWIYEVSQDTVRIEIQ